jgi:hypothetical protein
LRVYKTSSSPKTYQSELVEFFHRQAFKAAEELREKLESEEFCTAISEDLTPKSLQHGPKPKGKKGKQRRW